VGQQQEVAERDDNHRIAPRAKFEKFHGHEHDQHGDAGVAPEQGTEFEQDTGAAGADQQDEQPATGQPLVLPPQAAGPEQQHRGQGAEPGRLVQGVRRRRRQRGGEQPGRGLTVKGFAGWRAHGSNRARASRQR
jgi:hypothetical protein